MRTANPVFQDGSKWFFWDETWTMFFGPFDDEETATQACQEYTEYMTTGMAARRYENQEWKDGEELKGKPFRLKGRETE